VLTTSRGIWIVRRVAGTVLEKTNISLPVFNTINALLQTLAGIKSDLDTLDALSLIFYISRYHASFKLSANDVC